MFILAGRREDRRHKMRYPQLPLRSREECAATITDEAN